MAANHQCETFEIAFEKKHTKCIKLFPESINKRMGKRMFDDCEMSPLEIAIREYGSFKDVKCLLEMGAELYDEVLFHAVSSTDSSIVELVLSFGADPNKKTNKSAHNCLVWALDYYFSDAGTINGMNGGQQLSIIKLLVNYGAECSYINYDFLKKTFGKPKDIYISNVMNIIYEDLKEPDV